jgi:signal peptidase I
MRLRSKGLNFPAGNRNMKSLAKGGGTQCRYPQYRETLPEGRSYLNRSISNLIKKVDDTEAKMVPEGQLLLMGDNRDRSADSRYPADGVWIGLVPTKIWSDVRRS